MDLITQYRLLENRFDAIRNESKKVYGCDSFVIPSLYMNPPNLTLSVDEIFKLYNELKTSPYAFKQCAVLSWALKDHFPDSFKIEDMKQQSEFSCFIIDYFESDEN